MFGGGVGGGGGGAGRENESRGLMSHMMMPLPPHQLNPSALAGNDDDEFPKRDERVPQWTHQETRDFISIRAELERDFTVAKRNKTLWEVVSGRMKELGYRRSADQCKCKWKNLVNRYKGKETSDQDSGRQCPFFEELHAVFTDRENKMQRMLLESESGSTQAKKRGKRISGDQSSEEFSDDEYEDAQSDGQRATKASNPKKQKVEKEKRLDKSSKQPNTRNINTGNTLNSVREMFQEFLQQQQRMEMMWKESMERNAYQRQVFEQEWRQSMEKLERERMMVEQAWREREDQRRLREESRAERRDALLTMLVNKLIQENHPSSR